MRYQRVTGATLGLALMASAAPGWAADEQATPPTPDNPSYAAQVQSIPSVEKPIKGQAGAGTLRLMFVCVLPNCMAPLIVQATLSFSSAILDAAALGFLGLGVQPPTPEWGTMLASARDYIERAWWVVSLPGLTILLSVLAINLMGDGLRDALDPKLKNAA